MRPGDIKSKRPSVRSVRSGPSIPRFSTAQLFAQTKVGFSQLVVKVEWGVAYLDKARGNTVKTARAELGLAGCFDTARHWLEQLMQEKDKSTLTSIFEGDSIEQLAGLESLCYKVELKVRFDKRRLDLLQRIAACNEILADLGHAEQLREAKIAELIVLEEEMEENPVEEVVPHLTGAAFFGSLALAHEQVFDFAAAAETYDKAKSSLRAAITVCRAVVKLKASVDAPESLLENDLLQLQRLESQTSMRIEHLQSLEPGAMPIPVEEQIEPVELSIHQDFKVAKKMMHWYAGLGGVAAVGVGGILYMSGPFGFALLAGGTVATAVVATFARNDQGESGKEGLKKALANIAEWADKVGKELAQTVTNIGKEVAKVAEALTPCDQKKSISDMA